MTESDDKKYELVYDDEYHRWASRVPAMTWMSWTVEIRPVDVFKAIEELGLAEQVAEMAYKIHLKRYDDE